MHKPSHDKYRDFARGTLHIQVHTVRSDAMNLPVIHVSIKKERPYVTSPSFYVCQNENGEREREPPLKSTTQNAPKNLS
jgi:hypothetical protein